MGEAGMVARILVLLGVLLSNCAVALAATDGFYNLGEVAAVWDGTDANRTKAPTANYDYTYGDESSVTYTLPWSFNFYGVQYSQVTVDTNGNVWFDPRITGSNPVLPRSAHSFDLATTSRGPVISAWNNDLSSYYYGGAFVQHKNNPERVVIEWQTETYTEEGYSHVSDLEVVLFQVGNVNIDYKSFNTTAAKDFGSGVSKGDGTTYLSLTSNHDNVFSLGGRSFLLQDIPIGTIIINGGAAFTNSSATVLTFSTTVAGKISQMQFSNDQVTWSAPEPFATNKNWLVADGNGIKTVYAKFKDTADNWSTAVSDTILLDTALPMTSASTSSGLYHSSQSVTLSCADGSGSGCDKIYYTIDGTTPTTASLVYSTPVVISATKTLKYFATDKATNIETVKTGMYTIDTTPPDVPIITNFTVPATSPSLTVSGIGISATEASGVAGYLMTESSTAPSASASGWSASPPTSYTFASEGAKTLFAWAKGSTGLVSTSSSASVTIRIPDTTKPTVDAFAVPTSAVTATVPVSAFSASDNVAITGYLITERSTPPLVSAAGWSATAPSDYTVTGLIQGTPSARALFAWVKDAAGNVSSSRSASVTITLTGPTLAFSAATLADGTSTKNPALNLSGSVTGNGSAVQNLTLAQNGAAPVVVPFDANGAFNTAIVLADGANLLTTVATDAGNNSSTDTRLITLAPHLADLKVTAPASGSFLKDPFVTVTGTVGAPQSTTVTLVVNGAAPEAVALSGDDFFSKENLISGPNTIVITATDSSTAVPGEHTATLSVTSDVSAPALSVAAPAAAFATPKSSVTLSGSVTDAVTTPSVTVTVDGVALASQPALTGDGSFSAIITLPAVATYAIVVTATDQSGNSSTVQRNVIKTYPSGSVADGISAPTIKDALKVLQFALGLVTPGADEQINVDVAPLVDGKPMPNGAVNGGDALVVLEKIVGTVVW